MLSHHCEGRGGAQRHGGTAGIRATDRVTPD